MSYILQNTFYGEPNNPMLAPRGVFMHKSILVISDTGQNRVLLWHNFKHESSQNGAIVLGQIGADFSKRNEVSATSLQYPSGVWTDGQRLIVADAWNHRVLIWNTLPTKNNHPADVVIGQPHFNTNKPNVLGIAKPPNAQTLNWPYGVWSNGTELWIADTGNRRVLYFNTIPLNNYAKADEVIGQDSFEDKDYDSNNAVWPYSVKINHNGELCIADTQFFRVLYWKHWKEALSKKADIIFGQSDINSSGQNQFGLKPNSQTLNWCYDACFDKQGLVIADTGNSRIIFHNTIPEHNNAIATAQVGQPNFETHGETSLSFSSNIQNEMYWPFAVNYCSDILLAADTGNHRILFYKQI